MLPHLSHPPAPHSPGTTDYIAGLLSGGGESRDHSQSNPEPEPHRELLRRKLTNNLSHLSSLGLRDNSRNTQRGIITISSTPGWLLTHRNILSLALTWPDLPGQPTIWRRELLEYWSKEVTWLTRTEVSSCQDIVSRCVTLCHVVSGTWNHWPHSSPSLPSLPFPTYLLIHSFRDKKYIMRFLSFICWLQAINI